MSYIPLLYLIPALAVAVLRLLSRNEELPAAGSETDGIRGEFCKMGLYLYKTLPVFKKPGHGAQTESSLAVLKPRSDADKARIVYYADKIGMTLLILCAGSLLSCLVSFSARSARLVDENGRIARGDYGKGSRKETLIMTAADDAGFSDEVTMTVTDRQYTKEEADALFDSASALLPAAVLNGNASLDEVRTDLDLVKKIEGYPFDIGWRIGNYSIIHSDGKLQEEQIPAEGIVVSLTAQFTYLTYTWEQELFACIYPPLYTGDELWAQGVQALLDEADRATINDDYIVLPDRIGESTYIWSGKIKDDASVLFLMILLAAGAVFVMRDKDLEKQVKEREEELLSDYPQFVSKLVLYLGAGMTVRGIFSKLATEYTATTGSREKPRFLYEEICRVVNELESGVSELTAYEHFSLRCRSKQYTRLCTLLSQNLRKGNSGLLPLLQEESKKALSERMDLARKRGEEAGTKLLLPMMLMLVIVMVMIIIPAYTSF